MHITHLKCNIYATHKYEKKFKNFWGSFNMMYSRSLNYQWELIIDPSLPYYHPGRDVNNFHFDFKLTYPIKF